MSTEPEVLDPESLVTTAAPDTMAMFMALMQQMSADNRDNMIAAIQEMKKPSEEEQAKIDAERAGRIAQAMRRVEAAMQADADKVIQVESCSHTMPNGQTNLRGQVMSNGFARVFCSHCQYLSPYFKATDVEKTQSGLNVSGWGPNAFRYLQSRIAQSAGEIPAPVPRVPPGATIIFN